MGEFACSEHSHQQISENLKPTKTYSPVAPPSGYLTNSNSKAGSHHFSMLAPPAYVYICYKHSKLMDVVVIFIQILKYQTKNDIKLGKNIIFLQNMFFSFFEARAMTSGFPLGATPD